VIFDTNILIFIEKNVLKIENLIDRKTQPKISIISYIESLGYAFKTDEDLIYMRQLCDICHVIPLSDAIVLETINLRGKHKIKLPDAIIYATALIEDSPLLTNNTDDFKKLGNRVKLIDPFTL
jgi:predicted nucleic acid-binding protein